MINFNKTNAYGGKYIKFSPLYLEWSLVVEAMHCGIKKKKQKNLIRRDIPKVLILV